MRFRSLQALAALVACSSAAWTSADCPLDACVGDLDQDQSVALPDLAILLSDFGCASAAGCVADLNGDYQTDIADLALLLAHFGLRCGPFEYPPPSDQAEAEQIALEMLGPGGPLFAPQSLIDRISIDLTSIRLFAPSLADQFHSGDWVPTDLIVALVPGASEQDYRCFNRYYEAEVFGTIPSLHLEFLRFPRALNAPAMAQLYAALPAINYGEPNGLFGGQNYWRPTPQSGTVWRWEIDDGFTDCFDGCDCHRLWTLETDGLGGVTLISYQEAGLPWCEF